MEKHERESDMKSTDVRHREHAIAPGGWWATPGILALSSSIALAISLPPLHFSAAIWLAPLGWLTIIRNPSLAGKRPYLKIWAANFAFWLIYLWGIRNAHVALYAGWLALAAYVAIYVPLFIVLTRYLVHRRGLPLLLTAPAIWVLTEIARGHLFSGFAVGLLGHALVEKTWLIQIADLGGAYAVSGMIVVVATAMLEFLFPVRRSSTTRGVFLAIAIGTVLASLGYSALTIGRHEQSSSNSAVEVRNEAGKALSALEADPSASEAAADRSRPPLRIALVQESLDTVFDGDPERSVEMFRKYRDATRALCEQDSDLDLVVWPESAFTANIPDQLLDDAAELNPPPGFEDRRHEYQEFVKARSAEGPRKAASVARVVNPQETGRAFLIAGSDTIDYRAEPYRIYNSALLVNPQGDVAGRYFKQHPVMFGEYVPFAEQLPWLARITPIGAGIAAGKRAEAFSIRGFWVSPSICFESTVPHLIRRQVKQLVTEGKSPDVLINLTNDGWFWGSTILDMHFHCAVFRAVENRRPVLIAANTGISGWIDASGKVVARAERRRAATIIASISSNRHETVYTQWGDLGLIAVAFITLVAGTCFGRLRASGPVTR